MTTSAILAVRFDSVPMPAHRFILLVYPFSWLDSIQFYLIPGHSWQMQYHAQTGLIPNSHDAMLVPIWLNTAI